MKKVMLIALCGMLSLTSFANTTNELNEGDPKEKTELVSQEISKLLKHPSFSVDHNFELEVTFTLNAKNEIVVLDVNSKEDGARSYITNRLNYQILKSKELKHFKHYSVKVTVMN